MILLGNFFLKFGKIEIIPYFKTRALKMLTLRLTILSLCWSWRDYWPFTHLLHLCLLSLLTHWYPTNLKVDEKLKLNGNRTCVLRVSSPLLYHWATSKYYLLFWLFFRTLSWTPSPRRRRGLRPSSDQSSQEHHQ